MTPDHNREHAGHGKGDAWLVGTVVLNVLLTVAQLIGGAISGSLALVADALHNLNDAASLAIAVAARRIARRPADRRRTFGYRRAEVIAALIQLTALIVTALYLTYEAVMRFFEDQQVQGWTVVIVAGIALVIDIASAIITHVFGGGTMNMRAAFLHKAADALASVGVIVAGVLIILFEWHVADLLASLGIAAYILWAAYSQIRGPIRVLMEGAPEDVNPEEVADRAATVEGVLDVHHVHVWQLDETHRALVAHVVVAESDLPRMQEIKERLRLLFEEEFRVRHSTLELESPDEAVGHEEHSDDS